MAAIEWARGKKLSQALDITTESRETTNEARQLEDSQDTRIMLTFPQYHQDHCQWVYIKKLTMLSRS